CQTVRIRYSEQISDVRRCSDERNCDVGCRSIVCSVLEPGRSNSHLGRNRTCELNESLPELHRIEIFSQKCAKVLQEVLTHHPSCLIRRRDPANLQHIYEISSRTICPSNPHDVLPRWTEHNIAKSAQHITQFGRCRIGRRPTVK